MCICLPNGKFNFKFSRSYPCLGKKDSAKHKPNLTLIEESSEEEEAYSKAPVVSNGNGVKKTGHNKVQTDYGNHQGHYRQLSRDRQLPPVPDAEDFHISQPSTFRQSSFKMKHKSSELSNFAGKELPKQNTEDYGSILDSETYGEPKSNAQSPLNGPPLPFKMMMVSDDIKDVDPLYSIVVPPLHRRPDHKDDPGGGGGSGCRVFSQQHPQQHPQHQHQHQHCDHDSFLIEQLNDHGYSIIIKKTPLNEFSSLRKPDRSKAISREQCHQSLQSLSNQAPGLPVRLYKESDIFHLRNGTTRRPAGPPDPTDIRVRDPSKSSRCSSNSIGRRFSQPVAVPAGCGLHDGEHDSGTVTGETDVLKSLQSCFNTPPIKRASLSDLCVSTHRHLDNDESTTPYGTVEVGPILRDSQEPPGGEIDVSDFYRRITVRESLASLRERNALPDESGAPVPVAATPLQHVYEYFYETLYYSSADNNGRPGVPQQHHQHQHQHQHPGGRSPGPSPPLSHGPQSSPLSSALPRQASQERLPFLNHDNYLSITENPLGPGNGGFPGQPHPLQSATSSVVRRGSIPDGPAHERSSFVYAAIGSDIYAEISDVYLSKQYEELPADTKQQVQVHKSSELGGGQVNNGFVECSSPGSVRVMLEIQSFRHMDSDVDISSRCTTPLHPLGTKSGGIPRPTSTAHWRVSDNGASSSCSGPAVIRHPWFLPQKSVVPLCVSDGASPSSSDSLGKPLKVPQNSLVVMTPLMERSMEDASAFAALSGGESGTTAGDCCSVYGNGVTNGKGASSSQQAAPRRILYPPFHDSSDAL